MPRPIRARARFAIASFTLGLALSACGDDDPTGPVDVDIVGIWVMDVTGTASTGRTCTISDIVLVFVRNNNVVEGIMEGGGAGTVVCPPSSPGSFSGSLELDDVVEDGRNVQFTLPDAMGTWSVSGTFTGNGNSMSGDVTFYLRFSSSGILEFNGSWTATRS